jgi:hypothetical protein
MSHYNRAQRRELAKGMGMIPESETPEQWKERIKRSQEAGRQIDRQFKNNSETNRRNAAADTEARVLNSLIEKYGEESANEIMTNNRKVAEERAAKMAKRRAKQAAAYKAKQSK